jgi:hypothetical protein
MSRKNIEIVHWTAEEEEAIKARLPKIKSESGRYLLSTKSPSYQELKKLAGKNGRSETALNIKVRAMLGHSPKLKAKIKTDRSGQAKQELMRDLYGSVSYDQFIMLYNTIK